MGLNEMFKKIASIESEKTELGKHEVQLNALEEIRKAEIEPNAFMDKAIALKNEAKQNFINAQNKYKFIIDLCDKYLPIAKEIGDDNTVKIFNNKRKMANDMVKALKLDIDKLK
jgi:hypothetical protein